MPCNGSDVGSLYDFVCLCNNNDVTDTILCASVLVTTFT
jgi:hypothetical protein